VAVKLGAVLPFANWAMDTEQVVKEKRSAKMRFFIIFEITIDIIQN
ncbi:MAG: hypothetical protein RIR11_2502, partial [Bacteroidota bacterium]